MTRRLYSPRVTDRLVMNPRHALEPHTPLDQRFAPIGVYDSGVGGLSVLRALKAKLPGESFIYVADSGHAPYGDRPASFVEQRSHDIAAFLNQHAAKALVIACNTASVVAAQGLREAYAFPIVAMEPAIKPATQLSHAKVVLVLATSTTVRSPAVARLCSTYGNDVRFILQACPGLADRVERGGFDDAHTRQLLQSYLQPGLDAGADTIVLGCTHYAFLADTIAQIAGRQVQVLEPSEAVANRLSSLLTTAASPAEAGAANTTYYTSGPPHALATFLARIGEPAQQVHVLPADVA